MWDFVGGRKPMGELGWGVAGTRGIRASRLSAVSAAVMVLGCSSAAYAADLGNMPTKAPPAPPGPTTCTSIEDFFTTACQLSWYGVRFYGTVDVGGGYQTNGSRFAKWSGAGINYFLGKANNGGKLGFSSNGLSGSSNAVQVKEPLVSGVALCVPVSSRV